MSTADQDPTRNKGNTPNPPKKKGKKKKIKQIQQEKQKEEIANVLKQKIEQISVDFKRNIEVQMSQFFAKLLVPSAAPAENKSSNEEESARVKTEFELKLAEILANHVANSESQKLSTASGTDSK